MKLFSLLTLSSAALLGLMTLPVAAATPASEVPAVLVAETERLDAEVLAVDMKTRVVALKLASGEVVEIVAGDAVKNLAQVRVGDRVAAEYQQALAMKLKKGGGLRSTVENSGAARAKPGQKPAGMVAQEIDFVADVTAVDAKTGVVTILGAKGRVVKLRVRDPQVLAEIKAGDQVEGTYVQAMAIAVTPRPVAKK